MALHIKAADVPVRRVAWTDPRYGAGEMAVRMVHGKDASMMVAVRQPGYHTRPHKHDAEQINHVLEGEIWFFVEDQAFHCKQGDFQRIPRNAVHWAWNRSDKPAVVVELHSPPLIGGDIREGVAALLDERETPDVPAVAANEFVPYDAAAVEARYPAVPAS
jgi:quercetin dioxygenase-like cupin family protein